MLKLFCVLLLLWSCLLRAGQGDPQAEPIDGERLSDWLLRQPFTAQAYPYGLALLVPSARLAQADLQRKLVEVLRDTASFSSTAPSQLQEFIQSLPVTGRVQIQQDDPRWLQAHPKEDPILRGDYRVLIPSRPSSVLVLNQEGGACALPHRSGLKSFSYVQACKRVHAERVDEIWVIQANGVVQRFGAALWNRESQEELSPGSVIWAPERGLGISTEFSAMFAQFLATQRYDQLVTMQNIRSSDVLSLSSIPSSNARDAEYTANDWGSIGLIQTPSARMAPVGEARFHYSSVYPYNRYNTFFQPFDRFEFGFRYTDITNALYGPPELSGSQTYKDKSIDVKGLLFKETAFTPQIALGIVDVTGTGLFSGEYLVANKRLGDFDWSLGLGWGYLGSRADFSNPLNSILGKGFQNRQNDVGQGGQLATGAYFRGNASVFGGVQYHTPFNKVILKIEYEGNNYQNEPFSTLPQNSPFNFSAVYRYNSSVDFSLGFERGNTFMFGLTLHTSLAKVYVPKVSDPPTLKVFNKRPITEPRWEGVAADIQAYSGWSVDHIGVADRTLDIVLDNVYGTHFNDRLERVIGLLHRYAPARIEEFSFVFVEKGLPMTQRVVNRQAWVNHAVEFQGIDDLFQVPQVMFAKEPLSLPESDLLFTKDTYSSLSSRFGFSVGPFLQQSLGGPDAFVLFRAGVGTQFQYKIFDSTAVTGAFNLGLVDNYGKFQYDAPSNIPRVRTNVRQYMTTSPINLANLQLTHISQLADNHYYSMYGGYLESMFAGVGGEWLYRPWHSPFAFGIDINRVQQRSFQQDLTFNNAGEQTNYQVTTGHATAYWDTGWESVLAKMSVGRYLAGDKGTTIDLSKTFDNGVQIGLWLTKTNLSAADFGEGSFDKGLYLNIPFDVMTTTRSSGATALAYHPLIRDGGAKLDRAMSLYNATNLRDKRQTSFFPFEPPGKM